MTAAKSLDVAAWLYPKLNWQRWAPKKVDSTGKDIQGSTATFMGYECAPKANEQSYGGIIHEHVLSLVEMLSEAESVS